MRYMYLPSLYSDLRILMHSALKYLKNTSTSSFSNYAIRVVV